MFIVIFAMTLLAYLVISYSIFFIYDVFVITYKKNS